MCVFVCARKGVGAILQRVNLLCNSKRGGVRALGLGCSLAVIEVESLAPGANR